MSIYLDLQAGVLYLWIMNNAASQTDNQISPDRASELADVPIERDDPTCPDCGRPLELAGDCPACERAQAACERSHP